MGNYQGKPHSGTGWLASPSRRRVFLRMGIEEFVSRLLGIERDQSQAEPQEVFFLDVSSRSSFPLTTILLLDPRF